MVTKFSLVQMGLRRIKVIKIGTIQSFWVRMACFENLYVTLVYLRLELQTLESEKCVIILDIRHVQYKTISYLLYMLKH